MEGQVRWDGGLGCEATQEIGTRQHDPNPENHVQWRLEETVCEAVFFIEKEDPTMARRRGHTQEQILAALRQTEVGMTVVDVCWQA